MAEKSKLSVLLKKNRFELDELSRKSVGWFEQKARSIMVPGTSPAALMRGDQKNKSATIIPGSMYMYIYDPIHKETLPFYDTFPLVIPFRKEAQYFWGLNLHYLPYRLRIQLLEGLMDLGTTGGADENKRIRLAWDFISKSSRLAMVKPCVKQYHLGHVRTPFKRIDSTDWPAVCLLPSEQFVKADKNSVWEESLRIIRGNK